MIWQLSHRASKRNVLLADRHYSRQKVGSPQFVKPGRCLVLGTPDNDALWVTSWPFPEYVKHQWAGAWECSLFRNESPGLASDMIRQAVAATRACLGEPPGLGMITSIDPRKVEPVIGRGLPTFGYSWIKAGFQYVGRHKNGQLVFRLSPGRMPEPEPPHGVTVSLFGREPGA